MYLQHNHVRSSGGGQVLRATQHFNKNRKVHVTYPLYSYYSYYSYYSDGDQRVAVVSRNLSCTTCIATTVVRSLQHGFSCMCRRQSTLPVLTTLTTACFPLVTVASS